MTVRSNWRFRRKTRRFVPLDRLRDVAEERFDTSFRCLFLGIASSITTS